MKVGKGCFMDMGLRDAEVRSCTGTADGVFIELGRCSPPVAHFARAPGQPQLVNAQRRRTDCKRHKKKGRSRDYSSKLPPPLLPPLRSTVYVIRSTE